MITEYGLKGIISLSQLSQQTCWKNWEINNNKWKYFKAQNEFFFSEEKCGFN